MKTTQRIGAMLLISSMLLTGVSVAEEPSNPPAATEALVTTAPTEAPSATPAPENPTDEPTATPDPENPTDEPTATPEIPTCDVEGCAHISQDENGLDYPLCRYGRYLLDEEDAYSAATPSNDLRIVDLNRADVTFYRSGQYALIGDRKGAAVRVVKNRAAILELRGASIGTLTVEANAVVYIRAADNSLASIKKLEVASGAAVIFSEGGAISIGTVNSKGDISVEGTNLFADLTEMNGRARYAFSASGVQSVLVEGERYAWSVTPDADGKLYLWLKRPGEGMQWTATVTEGPQRRIGQHHPRRAQHAQIRHGVHAVRRHCRGYGAGNYGKRRDGHSRRHDERGHAD